jgi:pyruvate,water dikinase
VLQTRPLKVQTRAGEVVESPAAPGYPVLLTGGAVASPGVGCGPAFLVERDEDLLHFPQGAVLVARHSSPKFVVVMARAQAIVTDSGSVAGHMAAVAREFGIPSLLDTKTATRDLPPGMEITVDAFTGRVYQGRVPELLALAEVRQPHMQDTPIYRLLRRVADHIVPLNLLDPRAESFAPASCRTLHDLGRLVHEYSYQEMFRISDLTADRGGGALKLDAPIPLDLYLIDLGKGLSRAPGANGRVTPAEVASVPFAALLKGMLDPRLKALEPRPVEFSGLFSVMREQWLSAPQFEERFGEKSYAVISDKYLNFSSRVGYHFSVLDAYCGATVNKNYITFSFKGGAADEQRRHRRVRAIAVILTALDFEVDVKADRVDAKLQKYDCELLQEKLVQIGRLLLYTRQMDMLMTSEFSVEAAAQNFLAGNYSLEPSLFQEAPQDTS